MSIAISCNDVIAASLAALGAPHPDSMSLEAEQYLAHHKASARLYAADKPSYKMASAKIANQAPT
jgi:hypothetical protein